MQIQSVDNNYLIQIEQSAVSLADLQRMLDYLRVKNIATYSQAMDAEVAQLADEMTQSGWDSLRAGLLSRINP